MRIFYPLVDISIRLTLLLDFLLNACRKVCSHFLYYFLAHEFAVVLLLESKNFY